MIARTTALLALLLPLLTANAQRSSQAEPSSEQTLSGWSLQDVAKLTGTPAAASLPSYRPQGWYPATVPGTVLTTLVDNHVYPEPLYGENMRAIPESLNKTTYWYRTTLRIPSAHRGRQTWLHFGGINYSAEVWVNGHEAGAMRGAFIRGDFDITRDVQPGHTAAVLVVIAPEPHPGEPHEHTVAHGLGLNGGATALDGPTFLSTIGWDWMPAIRDRDTGIWQPVTLDSTGPIVVRDPVVTSTVDLPKHTADLDIRATLLNTSTQPITGTVSGLITGPPATETNPLRFEQQITLAPSGTTPVAFNSTAIAALHLTNPQLWWPNGYGPQNLYKLNLSFKVRNTLSSQQSTRFGIRKIDTEVPDSENLTLSVNGVKIMVRGGNWGLDEALKRIPRRRLDAQFHMHALANLNMIRNWVGQSTSPDFYDLADQYGILLWDEFFQPNPSDGPNPADLPTYLANVTDKVVRYRNHPSIAIWCARNEGYPPKSLDDTLRALMGTLDPTRLYQSNSADGRGVSSHGPYYWRSPRFYYRISESFKTETGAVSVPTLESIQGMMPQKDWETMNDDWAQHDMAHGGQRGDEYPTTLATRYGHIRNLADFARKGQLANYEAYRAMFEGRSSYMFRGTTGILSWMSHPAQPSFVWQFYHYDLEPNAALYAVKKASEQVHIQLNEETGHIEVVNNRPDPLSGLTVHTEIYGFDGKLNSQNSYPLALLPGSSTVKAARLEVSNAISPVFFVKLDLTGSDGQLLSTNFYWQNVAQDDFTTLAELPTATLEATADSRVEGPNTLLNVTLRNPTPTIALLAHMQLHGQSGERILPVFYSDNYLNLVPGESRTLTIEAATADLHGGTPTLLIDGFNVDVKPVNDTSANGSSTSTTGAVNIALNINAQPMHTPASNLVPNPPPWVASLAFGLGHMLCSRIESHPLLPEIRSCSTLPDPGTSSLYLESRTEDQ